MTRTDAARAWANVLAYIACGRPDKAQPWAAQLVAWWREQGVEV